MMNRIYLYCLLLPLVGCNLRGADLGPSSDSGTSSSSSSSGATVVGGVMINAVYGSATVSTFAGTQGAGGHVDAAGSAARMSGMAGMGTDGVLVYFTEKSSHTLRSLDPVTAAVATLAGTAFVHGDSPSLMYAPADVIPGGGGLYMTEGLNHALDLIFPPFRSVVAGQVNISGGYLDGPALSARFWTPTGLVQVGSDIYIADMDNDLIRKFDTISGQVSTFAGVRLHGGTADGPATTATFLAPSALESDGTYLYVGDLQGFKIRKINIATGVVSTLSGVGTLGGQVDGSAASAQFGQVLDLALSGGYLYVADAGNHSVRKVNTSTGDVTTVAGRRDRSTYVDGAGSVAGFCYPAGLAVVGASMFVTDPQNFVIRKITGF